jgi:stress-induced morphogen
MPMPVETLHAYLAEAFPDAEIAIDDLAGDGDHYRARIVSGAFAGLSRVKQHQLVYAALKGQMGGELHALALETSAPEA